jgi:hypothetical protein
VADKPRKPHKPVPKTSGASGDKSRKAEADSRARAAAGKLAQLDNDARREAAEAQRAAEQAAKDAAAETKP